MDVQSMNAMISRMIHPNATVSSLTMYANSFGKSYPNAFLSDFMKALCQQDIFKAATVAHNLSDEKLCQTASETVYPILVERCQDPAACTHLDLLAIAIYDDAQLLQQLSPFLTAQQIQDAFAIANATASCQLLRMGLMYLPMEHFTPIRQAFCAFLTQYSSRMDSALSPLIPVLIEYGAVDVLSTLMEYTGIEKVEALYGKELYSDVNHLIMTGKDCVPFWEIFFTRFFAQTRTPEELLEDGLWHIQLYANEDIYYDVCAMFYLYVARHYGVDHPIFDHIGDLEFPEELSRTHILRYRQAVESLWEQPELLSHFLDKTAPCNPLLAEDVQGDGYHFLKKDHDPVAYDRLAHLFEMQTPISTILNIFFSTDLKLRLPLEEMFYLVSRYEIRSEFLAALQNMTFFGRITKQNARSVVLSPYAYFVTKLHVQNTTYQMMEAARNNDGLKGKDLPYTITGFSRGAIKIALNRNAVLLASGDTRNLSWLEAIVDLENVLSLPHLSENRAKRLAIVDFSLDSIVQNTDLSLLTQLILEHPDKLSLFREIFRFCKWNTSFTVMDSKLPGSVFNALEQYQESAAELFRTLFAAQSDLASVLDFYFTSIYRAILPLDQLLSFADREHLLELLPNYIIYCRRVYAESSICRLSSICCAPICSVSCTEHMNTRDAFPATITDIILQEGSVFRIYLKQYNSSESTAEERGAMFGYLALNIPISERRTKTIATYPSVDQCTPREIMFNMSCMEKAIQLRKSTGKELHILLQTLGDANPFTFQLSPQADGIYLQHFYPDDWRKEAVANAAISIILNASDILAVREFYLHTNMKFHLSIPQLARLVYERRRDLRNDIPNLFGSTVFYGIVDYEGMLWMPWIKQNTLRAGKEYAGMFVLCRLRVNRDRSIQVTVIQAYESDIFDTYRDHCLLAGYEPLAGMGKPTPAQSTIPETPDDSTISPLNRTFAQLSDMLYDPQFEHKEFAKAISKQLRTHKSTVSVEKMEKTVAALTDKWISLYPSSAEIQMSLISVLTCYVAHYQSKDLCRIVGQQLQQHLPNAEAASLKKKISKIPLNQQPPSPEPAIPFEEALALFEELLYDDTCSAKEFTAPLNKFVRKHRSIIPADEMEAAVANLTKKWIPLYQDDPDLEECLCSIYLSFWGNYHTRSIGTVLCDQARRYLDNSFALNLALQFNHATPADIDLFHERIKLLEEMIHCPDFSANDFSKNISSMIRKYNSVISAEEMEADILMLTEKLVPVHLDHPHLGDLLAGIHFSFSAQYPSSNLARAFYEQNLQYLEGRLSRYIDWKVNRSKPQNTESDSTDIERK